MFTNPNYSDSKNIVSGLIGFILCGIIYENKFKSRPDWVSLNEIFYLERAKSYVLKTYQKLNGQIFIPVSADLERYDFLNLCAAVGSKRLNRKIAASGIYFDVGTHDPKELFEQCKIYFYDVGVDYGPYSNLPPYVSRILTPFKDYFIISGEAVAERPFSFGFAPVKITSDESEFTGEALEINFSEQFQLARVQLVANTGVDLKVDFESKQVELRFNGGVSRLFTFESAVTDIKHTTEVLSRWLSQ